MKVFKMETYTLEMALVAKERQSYRGKSWDIKKAGKFQPRKKGMIQSKFEAYNRKDDDFFYCGKPSYIAKDCYKKKAREYKQKFRKHHGNYVKGDTSINDGVKSLKLFVFEAALLVETNDENAWFIDSRGSTHMSCNKKWFGEYHENTNGTHIYLGDNKSHKVHGYLIICVNFPNGQMKHIHNVMYVRGTRKNLIYVSTITDKNLIVEFMQSHCYVKDIQNHYNVIAMGTRLGGLYKFDVTKCRHQALPSSVMLTEELWHCRYGHLSQHDLVQLQKKSVVEGIPKLKSEYLECEACALGKQHREEFPLHTEKKKES